MLLSHRTTPTRRQPDQTHRIEPSHRERLQCIQFRNTHMNPRGGTLSRSLPQSADLCLASREGRRSPANMTLSPLMILSVLLRLRVQYGRSPPLSRMRMTHMHPLLGRMDGKRRMVLFIRQRRSIRMHLRVSLLASLANTPMVASRFPRNPHPSRLVVLILRQSMIAQAARS